MVSGGRQVRQSLHTFGEVIIPLLAAGKDPDVCWEEF